MCGEKVKEMTNGSHLVCNVKCCHVGLVKVKGHHIGGHLTQDVSHLVDALAPGHCVCSTSTLPNVPVDIPLDPLVVEPLGDFILPTPK